MKYLQTLSLTSALSVAATVAPAADYSDDIHKNDYKWLQFNLMYAYKELPRPKDANSGHDYLEMEFGGRSGFFDLYGYLDIFNLTNSDNSDKKGSSKTFVKLQPRFSLDAITGKDLSFGPVQELYFSTLFNWGGGGANYTDSNGDVKESIDVNNSFWGLGADVMVPWFGKVGVNLYGLYELNKKAWNGYQISTNWFKPFVHFENNSFISYQGYIDYQFGAKDKFKGNEQATSGGVMFNGFYWHSERWAAGYGFKLYKDVYLIKDSKKLESTGISHYVAVTYKF
ncbi:MAG: outer membrane protein OmpK [Endozoicomonas sp.]|uniref:nucleoside-specific channel-forming Tsx family protein n=1 Tax=Endozoicomonas sp. TaxID=1892382 RepID=UPI003D9B800E